MCLSTICIYYGVSCIVSAIYSLNGKNGNNNRHLYIGQATVLKQRFSSAFASYNWKASFRLIWVSIFCFLMHKNVCFPKITKIIDNPWHLLEIGEIDQIYSIVLASELRMETANVYTLLNITIIMAGRDSQSWFVPYSHVCDVSQHKYSKSKIIHKKVYVTHTIALLSLQTFNTWFVGARELMIQHPFMKPVTSADLLTCAFENVWQLKCSWILQEKPKASNTENELKYCNCSNALTAL